MRLKYKTPFIVFFIFFVFFISLNLFHVQVIFASEKLVNIIKISAKETDGSIQVIIMGDGALRYRYKEISEPPKILLEIPNSKNMLPYRELIVEKGNINKIVISSKKDKMLFEIELFKASQSNVSLSSNQKLITLKVDEQKKDDELIENIKKDLPIENEKNMESEVKIESDENGYILAYPEINKIIGSISEEKVRLQIMGDNEIAYKIKEVNLPPQIIITIPDFTLNLENNVIDMHLGGVKNVEANQISYEPLISEIKVNFTQKTNYNVILSSDRKEILIEIDLPKMISKEQKEIISKEQKEEKKAEITLPESKVVKGQVPSKINNYITDVHVKKFPEETIISIIGTEPIKYKLIEVEKPYKFIIEIYNAILKTTKKEIKVEDGGIKNIKITQKGKPTQIVKIEILLLQKLQKEISLTPDTKQMIFIIKLPEKQKIITKELPTPKKPKIEIPLPPDTIDIKPLPPISSQKLITMDFKEADIVDVIKIFSEMTGVNLIVDNVVSGKVTISLKDVPFEQALEMVLAPNDLMVHLIGDTYIVVPRKDMTLLGRIGTGTAFGGLQVETFPIKNYTPDQFYNILKEIMPEFEGKAIQTNRPDVITLIGTRSSLDKVRNFITQMDPIQGAQVKTFDLKGQRYEDVVKILEKTVPEVKNGIIDVGSKSTITIVGSKGNIAQVEKIISSISISPSYKIITLTSTELEKFKKILLQQYPQVEIIDADLGNKVSSVTLKGSKDDFEEVEKLVGELNKRESQAKEIEIIKLQHFETLNDLREQKGEDITKLITAFVPGVVITPDTRTNSIIVEGTSLEIKRIKELIPKIDTKVPMIRLYVQAIDSKSPISKYFTPGLLVSGPYGSGNTSSGEFQINFIKDKAANEVIRATLSTLESKEEIRYLTNTELHTFSGRKVELEMFDKHSIAVGDEKIFDKDGKIIGIIPKYEQLDIGIKVTITPRIKFEIEGDKVEEYIILLIDIVIKSPTGEKPRDAKISVNERKMTDVLVRTKPRESIVISGLFTEYERERITRTPILSKIPLIGKAFVQKEKERTGSEVTIMITPEVNPTK